MSLDPPHTTELRGLVRDILREAMAGRASVQPGGVESVTIANDADLAGFVRMLITRLDSPAAAATIRNGQHRFTLDKEAATAAHGRTLIEGVITEHKIEKFASAGTLVLAPGAILTPLARDRARKLGLKIERRR